MEEAKDMIERGSQLCRHDSTLGPVLAMLTIRQYVDFGEGQAFSSEPNDVVVEVQGRRISGEIKLPKLSRSIKLAREQDRKA